MLLFPEMCSYVQEMQPGLAVCISYINVILIINKTKSEVDFIK